MPQSAPIAAPPLDLTSARALACGLLAPILDAEQVGLAQAIGRIAAQDIRASHALPRQPRAAMDGFALACADCAGFGPAGAMAEGSLPVAGTVAAGMVPPALPRAAALRIFTGAVLPAGADAVVPFEDCRDAGDRVWLSACPEPWAYVRRVGEDQPEGGVLLRQGTRIGARHLGLLAANGVAEVAVLRRPRLAIVSSGTELAGAAAGRGANAAATDTIPDVNRPLLIALARAAGAEVIDLGILPDDRAATVALLVGLGAQVDLLVSTGGVSMGHEDHLRPALLAAGGEIAGWRVALKPGRPALFGRLGATALTGLPGNPFAAFVGFHLFIAAQIATLLQQPVAPAFPARGQAGFDWHRKPGRAEVFAVRRDLANPSRLIRLGAGSSATLFPLAEAEGLAFVPADTTEVTPGMDLDWLPFSPCFG